MSKELSIVIPIFNEEKNILPLTKKIKNTIKNYKFEIIFVDDSSLDGSRKLLKKLKKKYNFFKPIFRSGKRDLSKSCISGIKKTKYSKILIMDGDLQHDPKYIPTMYEKISNNKLDIVIGTRKLFEPNNKGLSEIRRYVSIFLIFCFKIFDIKTKDPMSGFFMFNKEIYLRNEKFFFAKGFKILADFLINCKQTLKTQDVNINFNRRYNSKSKMNYKILFILIYFYLKSLFKKYLV